MVRTRLYTEDEALALVRVVHARAYRYGWGDGAMGHAMQPPRDLLDGETVPEYVLRCAGLSPLPPLPQRHAMVGVPTPAPVSRPEAVPESARAMPRLLSGAGLMDLLLAPLRASGSEWRR